MPSLSLSVVSHVDSLIYKGTWLVDTFGYSSAELMNSRRWREPMFLFHDSLDLYKGFPLSNIETPDEGPMLGPVRVLHADQLIRHEIGVRS